jgi:hypothetical protein
MENNHCEFVFVVVMREQVLSIQAVVDFCHDVTLFVIERNIYCNIWSDFCLIL